jgi:outer membrane receptor protein involved in Fe transport
MNPKPLLFAAVACFVSAGPLHAQAVAQPSVNPKEDETVSLSPFVVNTAQDTGWVASTTLMGNRSNEQLMNLPMSVDVLTADFMRDMGVFEIEDASAMIANTVVTSILGGKLDEARVTFRGFQLGDNVQPQSGRNFFPVFTPQDTYNVERIDFAKGANSLMFGSEQPGGLATTYTKRAYFSSFNSASIIVDSYGSYRLMLDVNRKLTDRLAARLNLVDRVDKTYIEFARSNLRAADLALTYKLFQNTQVRLEAEGGQFYRKRAVNSARLQTQSAPGLGYSQTTRWTFSPEDGIILSTSGTAPPGAVTPSAKDKVGVAGNLMSFLDGQTVTVAMRAFVNNATVLTGQTLTLHGLSKKINLNGPNDDLSRPYSSVTAWLEQRFGQLNLEFSYNQQNQNQQRMDGGIPNQIDLGVTGDGRIYEEGAYQFKQFGNKDANFRILASYPVKLGWMSQFFVGSFESLKDAAYNFRYTLGNLAFGTLTNNDIKYRVYLDNPGYRSEAFWRQYMPQNLPRTPTFQPAWRSATTANRPFWDVRYSHTYALSANGTYWDGLFRTLVGVRHDSFNRKLTTVPPTNSIGSVDNPGSPEDNPAAYYYDPESMLSQNSYTAGLVFRPPFARNVNLYGSYSESFNWQLTTDFAGNPLGATLGQNREAGIKTALFDNKILLTAAVYRVDKTNDAFSFGGNLSAVQLDTLFNPIGIASNDPSRFEAATGFNGETTTAPQSSRSTGWELTLQNLRLHGIQTRITFGHNHKTSQKDMSVFRQYYDAAAARVAALPAGNPNIAILTPLLTSAATILRNNESISILTGTQSVPNTLTFSVDYEFPRTSFLKSTRIGVTGTWNDDYNISNSGGTLYQGGAQLPLSVYAIHERKIFEHEVYFRLGVRNLVDLENDHLRRTGVNFIDPAGGVNYAYQFVTPLSVEFNATVRF